MTVENHLETASGRALDQLVENLDTAETGKVRVLDVVDVLGSALRIEELGAERNTDGVKPKRFDLIEHRRHRSGPEAVRRVISCLEAEPADPSHLDLPPLGVHDMAPVRMEVARASPAARPTVAARSTLAASIDRVLLGFGHRCNRLGAAALSGEPDR